MARPDRKMKALCRACRQVRGLCVAETESAGSQLVSASRDTTVRTWAPAAGEDSGNSFVEVGPVLLLGTWSSW